MILFNDCGENGYISTKKILSKSQIGGYVKNNKLIGVMKLGLVVTSKYKKYWFNFVDGDMKQVDMICNNEGKIYIYLFDTIFEFEPIDIMMSEKIRETTVDEDKKIFKTLFTEYKQ